MENAIRCTIQTANDSKHMRTQWIMKLKVIVISHNTVWGYKETSDLFFSLKTSDWLFSIGQKGTFQLTFPD